MTDTQLELECAVVGSLIVSGQNAGEMFAEISEDDFREPMWRTMFLSVRQLFNSGKPLDRLTVTAELGDAWGEAVDAAVKLGKVERTKLRSYAELLHRNAVLSNVQSCGLELAGAASVEDCSEVLDRLNGLMVTKRHRQTRTMADAMQMFFDRHMTDEKPQYLKWGMPRLDGELYAEAGDFIAIGGYPSAGKTALAAQFALTFARAGKRVGFFSLETTPEKLTDRIMAQELQMPLQDIKLNKFTPQQWKHAGDVAQQLSSLSLDQIPAAGMSVSEIRAYSLSRRYEVIFVDYLQIVRGTSKRGMRYEDVTDISMGLHEMSQSTGITVIALAQLARPEKSKNTKPVPPSMSSFKESGQIEQDIDIGLLLYREDPNDNEGRRVLKVGKNKEGRLSAFLLDFNGDTQTFSPAKPTKSEQYQKFNHEMAELKREDRARRRAAIDGQHQFSELSDEGPLPF